MKGKGSIGLLLFVCAFMSCTKSESVSKQLQKGSGIWEVSSYKVVLVPQTAIETELYQAENAGEFHFYENEFSIPTLDYSYLEYDSSYSFTGLEYVIDEKAKRLILRSDDCAECDYSFNILERKSNYMRLTTFTKVSTDISVEKREFELRRN